MLKIKLISMAIIVLSAISIIYFLSTSYTPKVKLSAKTEIRDGLIYIASSNKLFTGTCIDSVGDKIVEYDVHHGIRNGRFNIYNENGTPQISGQIKDNKNIGEWKYYFPDGSIECTGVFKNDKISDKWVWYYPNGKVKEEGFYIDGVREGSWVKYDPDGNIYSRISFRKDIIVNELTAEKFSSI